MKHLGTSQRACLKALSEHNNGAFYPACGWVWDNFSSTARILNSLVKRGLVSYEPVSDLRRVGRGTWRITDEGKEAL